MTLLYKWLTDATRAQGSAKALVYRDTYLSWRGLSHRVDRRVQEFSGMGIKKGDWVGLMLGNVPDFAILALALSKVGATVVPLDPTTVPLYHSYGFDCGLMLALRFGATLYLEDEVAPKRIVKLLREQEINVLPGTPGLYAGLAKLPTAKALKVKKPRYLSAGSLLSEATAEAFKARWGIRIVDRKSTRLNSSH